MESPEEVPLGRSKEHTNIVKGKRTKRVRPHSPIPFSITAISSTEGQKGDHNTLNLLGGLETVATRFSVGKYLCEYNNKNKDDNNTNNISSTPTTSSGGLQDSTNEEEDMANCLILLAQGQSRESSKHAVAAGGSEDLTGGMNYSKYSSKKFLEAGSGRAGYYVYGCKTCCRTFPSFQALGGHMVSHKKPKAISTQQKKQQQFNEEEFQLKTNNNNRPISLQFNMRGNLYSRNNNKCKVHECSICGAEFTSGQALGGHMRRHRAPVGTNTTLSLTPTPMALKPEEDQQPRKRRNVLPLDLDLNLPAPEPQDHPTKSNFAFSSKQHQHQEHSSLVFSTPSLVDCHY